MSVAISELTNNRRLSGRNRERAFQAIGASSEDEAKDALYDYLDDNDLLTLGGYTYSPDDSTTEDPDSETGRYILRAVWNAPGSGFQGIGNFSLSFDISGQTQKLLQAKSVIHQYVPSGNAIDYKGAINVSSDGTVEGVDIIVPSWTFGLTYFVSPGTITQSYIALLKSMVGKVNSDEFNGFQAGELLFSKVSGSRTGGEAWRLDLGWLVSENATSLSVGGITGITKKGWHYLSVHYKRAELKDTAGNTIAVGDTPRQVDVLQVYDEIAYAGLTLPTLLPS